MLSRCDNTTRALAGGPVTLWNRAGVSEVRCAANARRYLSQRDKSHLSVPHVAAAHRAALLKKPRGGSPSQPPSLCQHFFFRYFSGSAFCFSRRALLRDVAPFAGASPAP